MTESDLSNERVLVRNRQTVKHAIDWTTLFVDGNKTHGLGVTRPDSLHQSHVPRPHQHYGMLPLAYPKSGGMPAITFCTDGLASSASHHALTCGNASTTPAYSVAMK